MNGGANPYKRNGHWYFEVGPFATSRDALRALLIRIRVHESRKRRRKRRKRNVSRAKHLKRRTKLRLVKK